MGKEYTRRGFLQSAGNAAKVVFGVGLFGGAGNSAPLPSESELPQNTIKIENTSIPQVIFASSTAEPVAAPGEGLQPGAHLTSEFFGKDPVVALKALLSKRQADDDDEKIIFYRQRLETLPANTDFERPDGWPLNMIWRQGMNLTVIGLTEDHQKAAVSFDEGFNREKGWARKIPKQYFAIVPINVLKENEIDPDKSTINTLDCALFDRLVVAAGALWLDQKADGSWYENPVVPYPPFELTGPYGGIMINEEGQIVALSLDNTKSIAEAKYDDKMHQWAWEAMTIDRSPLKD